MNAWQSYIDVIYMTDFESTLIDAVDKDEVPVTARSGLRHRQNEQDISEKLNLLFGHGSKDERDGTTAPYESVDEALTSDTTENASEMEHRKPASNGQPSKVEGQAKT